MAFSEHFAGAGRPAVPTEPAPAAPGWLWRERGGVGHGAIWEDRWIATE